MWATLTLLTVLGVTPAQEEMQLTNARVTYGILGPARPDSKYVPGDTCFLTFDIEGLTKQGGIMRYGMKMELLDSKEKLKFSRSTEGSDIVDILGGTSVPGFAHAFIGLDTEPGEYTLKLTVTDQVSKKVQLLVRKFQVTPKDFGLVGVNTTYEGRVPAPPIVVIGQPLVLTFGIVGFERDAKTKQPRIELKMNVLDETGKSTQPKPITEIIGKNVEEKESIISPAFDLALTRAGKFTIELTATDTLNKKTSTVMLPLIVLSRPK
jgi:hypothetical protein